MAIRGFCSAQMPSCLTVLSLIVISCLGLSVEVGASSANSSSHDAPQCQDGLIIPMWRPFDNLSIGDRIARGLVYFVAMCYLFVGVSIIADRFMASIEVITSKEKEITLKRPNGDKQIIVVRVWNETVANLTLMALGSSAPEILLSIIEVYAKDFEAGELGPGTIVGSAAFNLFMIIGLCVYVIPDGESRKIKHLRVFFVTATWSVFAYVWLYIILAVTSYGVVDVWESVLTFLFFPATVITAYIADRRMLVYKYLSKNYRMNRRGMIVQTEGGENKAFEDVELTAVGSNSDGLKVFDEEVNEEVREFEEHRRQYIQLLRDLRKQNPNLDMRSLEAMAREQLANSGPKSRAYYRIQATRRLTGGSSLNKKAFELTHSDLSQIPSSANQVSPVNENVIRIFFDPGHYTVMENVGEFQVTVKREGGDAMQVVMVDYRTEDGTANAGSDYVAVQGTLTFGPGETTKVFGIRVIDDDVFEEDEHFYVRLSNARLGPKQMEVTTSVNGSTGHHSTSTSTTSGPFNGHKVCQVELVAPFAATVMILDDDHCGVFNVAEKDHELVESVGVYELKVTRWSGARGRVAVPFATKEGTAKPSKDYEHTEGEIVFENNEIEKTIPIQILEEDSYEKDVLFYVQIGEPRHLSDVEGSMQNYDKDHLSDEERVALQGKPRLGDITIAQIRVKESKEFKNTVDKLVQRTNASILVGTSSWKEQFIEAITVSPDVDEDGEETMPSCGDYILHFLTVFWKILFAFVPPTEHMGGWLCFWVAIIWIGILTAIIGDVASAFGCSVGLKDSVTAIAFVALGTSVPDTFASKVSAVQDKYADASVGNVTGSNAVNVFLGIGIAWSIAAIYHAYHGRPFRVEPGNLAFSVTLFCSTAFIALTIMMLRRSKKVGGELGGPKCYKILTSLIFVFLWLFYVAMSSLEAYGYIQGF